MDVKAKAGRFSRGGKGDAPGVSHFTCYNFHIFLNKGYRMLQTGILNTLFTRMDLPYATQLRCTRPPDLLLEGEEYPWDIMLLIMKLLWSLMRSVLFPNTLPQHLKDLPSPKQCAMWYYLLITHFNNIDNTLIY